MYGELFYYEKGLSNIPRAFPEEDTHNKLAWLLKPTKINNKTVND